MSRARSREVLVGLVMVAALVALGGLLALAGNGPGYLGHRRTIDVVFRDAQGVRAGCPVRVAGLDSGRVAVVDLTDIDGVLHARVRLSVPADLADRLRQDARITVAPSLTGPPCINIISSGRSAVALVPGQTLRGVETSLFDPILEQVGLGPVERNHLSHTIAEVRQTVDAAGPRLRQILGALQATAADFRETSDAVRPALVSTARRVDEAAPKLEAMIRRLDALVGQADGLVAENRPDLKATIANVRDLTALAAAIAKEDRPKVEALLDGLNGSRKRADRVLYQAEVLTTQGNDLVARNRANLDRTFANVRDTTDYGDKLVQKLYANPLVLSPFYKPTPEDVRAQATYDTAHTFLKGAKELSDSVKALQSMQAKPSLTAQERQAIDQLIQRASGLTGQLQATSRQLAEDLRFDSPPRRGKRQ